MRDSNGMQQRVIHIHQNRPQRDRNGPQTLHPRGFEETTMARITPIDVIKGISGKYGNGSSDSSVLTAVGELLMFGVMAQVPHLIEWFISCTFSRHGND